jgi:hypothetical protein
MGNFLREDLLDRVRISCIAINLHFAVRVVFNTHGFRSTQKGFTRVFFPSGASQQSSLYFGQQRSRTVQNLHIRCMGPRFATQNEPAGDTVAFDVPSLLTADGWLNLLPVEINPGNSEIRWAKELEDSIVAVLSDGEESYQILMTREDVTPMRWGLNAHGMDMMVSDKTIAISKADPSVPKRRRLLNTYTQDDPGFWGLAQTIRDLVEPFRKPIEEAIGRSAG